MMTRRNLYDERCPNKFPDRAVFITKDPLNDVYINMRYIKNVSNNMDFLKSLDESAFNKLEEIIEAIDDIDGLLQEFRELHREIEKRVPKTLQVKSGEGLQGGGPLEEDITLSLADEIDLGVLV